MSQVKLVNVPEWPRPKGYSNGAVVDGPTLFVAGQVGWTAECVFERADFVGQFAQAVDNVLAVVRAAGGQPSDVARMIVYVTDVAAYRASARDLGPVWRERFGKHYPAMALVGVAGLVEEGALLEIEAIAALPRASAP